jgi:hypothetical protein
MWVREFSGCGVSGMGCWIENALNWPLFYLLF